jgi:hypothetical protein
VTLTAKNARHYARELAAVIGIVLTTTNAVAWPVSIRATVLTISGVLLTVEHVLNGVANGKIAGAAASSVLAPSSGGVNIPFSGQTNNIDPAATPPLGTPHA